MYIAEWKLRTGRANIFLAPFHKRPLLPMDNFLWQPRKKKRAIPGLMKKFRSIVILMILVIICEGLDRTKTVKYISPFHPWPARRVFAEREATEAADRLRRARIVEVDDVGAAGLQLPGEVDEHRS